MPSNRLKLDLSLMPESWVRRKTRTVLGRSAHFCTSFCRSFASFLLFEGCTAAKVSAATASGTKLYNIGATLGPEVQTEATGLRVLPVRNGNAFTLTRYVQV